MHGCFLGEEGLGCDAPGLGNIPWGYLGDMGDATSEDLTGLDTLSLGEPGGILDPAAPPVTVGELASYVQTGNGDSSILGQLSQLVQAAGPAVQDIMQQVQFGQLASNTPISQLPALRAAVMGTGSTIGTTVSSILGGSSGALLLGAGVLLFLLKGKRRK